MCEQPLRGVAIDFLQILLILVTGGSGDNDLDASDERDDMKKVISVWFFCHVQMVTFAGSSVLLRLNVAPSRSFTRKNGHACVHKGRG
jgi:hypothetical protein